MSKTIKTALFSQIKPRKSLDFSLMSPPLSSGSYGWLNSQQLEWCSYITVNPHLCR